MKFSVIVPSFNQELFIKDTLENLVKIKHISFKNDFDFEILIFDSESNHNVQEIINNYSEFIDFIEIKKDIGQFDAINKGIEKCTGDYWTWLNTDDLIDIDGFLGIVYELKRDNSIDYIYGGINYINEQGNVIMKINSYTLNYKWLYSHTPAIFQPGSFFKKSFTNKIGNLNSYRCCFDYEYVLRCLKYNAKLFCCNYTVSNFRYYKTSKTGSITTVFIKEQLEISKIYGRKWYHFLTWFSYLRLFKHFLFPRK